MRQAVVAFLADRGAVPFPAMLNGVSGLVGKPVADNSLRSVLPRMEKAGEITKTGRGVYALINTNSPAPTGLFVPTTSQEGGTDAQTDNDSPSLTRTGQR